MRLPSSSEPRWWSTAAKRCSYALKRARDASPATRVKHTKTTVHTVQMARDDRMTTTATQPEEEQHMKRTALVTGANRGIGLAIARQLAELGRSVLLGSRDVGAAKTLLDTLRRLGPDGAPIHLDLTVASTVDATINDIRNLGRSVDVLVSNAGVLHEKPLFELTDAEIADSIAVHLTGPIGLIRALVPAMVAWIRPNPAESSTYRPTGGHPPKALVAPASTA
jgi:NAD(P)-dependent dehydrogenase (short-subunit alcohol dehydrogenase family)